MNAAEKKLTFAYLYYTRLLGDSPTLLGVFKSSKIAKTHLDLVNGEYVPIERSKRILQKINNKTEQIWYVEKHVMKDAI